MNKPAKNENVEKILQVFYREPKDAVHYFLSYAYPFTPKQLRKYKEHLDWHHISMNNSIAWTESLFYEFEDKINCVNFACITNFLWTEEFIDKHLYKLFYDFDREPYEYINPDGIKEDQDLRDQYGNGSFSENPALPWSEAFIDKYYEHIDWGWIPVNEGINFTKELIIKYEDVLGPYFFKWNKKIMGDPALKKFLEDEFDIDLEEEPHMPCRFCHENADSINIDIYSEEEMFDLLYCDNFEWDMRAFRLFEEVNTKTWHDLFVLDFLMKELEKVNPMEVFFFFSSRIIMPLFGFCHARENVCQELAGKIDIEELMDELIRLKGLEVKGEGH